MGANKMAKIEIEGCEHTSNMTALASVLAFMKQNLEAEDYKQEKEIYLDNGITSLVIETPMDMGNPTCSCFFKVSKIKEFNRIDSVNLR
jgi:hypothetical protein